MIWLHPNRIVEELRQKGGNITVTVIVLVGYVYAHRKITYTHSFTDGIKIYMGTGSVTAKLSQDTRSERLKQRTGICYREI